MTTRQRSSTWPAFLATFAVLVAASAVLPADDDQLEPFLAGLRQRRQYALANRYCREQLVTDKVDSLYRQRVVVEWMRVLAELATQSSPDERQQLVTRLRTLSADFGRENPDHPRLQLVQTQEALSLLAIGEVERHEAELSDRSNFDGARSFLRDGIRALESIDRELGQLIPQRFRRPPQPPTLSADELVALQHNLRFHLVGAQRQIALCFPAESPDRLAALAAALQLADRSIASLPADDALAPRLRLERVVLLRLLQRLEEIDEALAETAWADAPTALRLAAQAERIRLAIDQNRPQSAKSLLDESSDDQVAPAEFDCARLELCLALWKAAEAAKSAPESEYWEQQALDRIRRLEQRHGPAWRRRGDLMMVRTASAGRGPRSREALRRSGDHFYEQGRLEDAIAAYDRAAAQADQSGDADEQFALRYRAALVQQQLGRHADAADRLESLATSLPTQADAPMAHQLAAWNLAQALRETSAEQLAANTTRYQAMLERQCTQWPAAPATNEVRLWLGRLRESRREWAAAADVYRGVSSNSPHFAAALQGAGRAWLARLDELRANPAARRAEAEAAGRYFEQAAYGSDPDTLDRWTPAQREAALAAARAWLEPSVAQLARAERLLRSAIERSADAEETWRAAAESLLLVALAGQSSRQAEADARVELITKLEAPLIADALIRLAPLRLAATDEARDRIARLELRLYAALESRRMELPAAVRFKLEVHQASALVVVGRRADALTAYQALAKSHPRDAAVHESWAQLLMDGTEPAERREALAQWRRIAANSAARSERWYRAKYGVALCEFQLGNRKAAAQLIQFLQATPPGLTDCPLEPQFVELLRRCEE